MRGPPPSKTVSAMKHHDLNQCSTRQLMCIPGIEKGLADNVIKYKRTYGHFKKFDDIINVPGMNHSKYQLLRRNFRVYGERPTTVGTKFPNTPRVPLSLTESIRMKGQPPVMPIVGKVNNGNKKPDYVQKSVHYSTEDQTDQSHTAHIPTAVNRAATAEVRKSSPNNVITTGTKSLGSSHAKSRQADTGYSTTQESSVAMTKFGRTAGEYKPMQGITLSTTQKGHNINLSCTIDTRILKLKPRMAFQMNKDGIYRTKEDGVSDTGIYADEAGAKSFGSSRESKTLSPGLISRCRRTFPHMTHSSAEFNSTLAFRSHKSETETSTATPLRCYLSHDSITVHDKCDKPDEPERHSFIEAWVKNVNTARLDPHGHLLSGLERLEPKSKVINSSFNRGFTHPGSADALLPDTIGKPTPLGADAKSFKEGCMQQSRPPARLYLGHPCSTSHAGKQPCIAPAPPTTKPPLRRSRQLPLDPKTKNSIIRKLGDVQAMTNPVPSLHRRPTNSRETKAKVQKGSEKTTETSSSSKDTNTDVSGAQDLNTKPEQRSTTKQYDAMVNNKLHHLHSVNTTQCTGTKTVVCSVRKRAAV